MTHGLGRREHADDRDRQYLIRRKLPAVQVALPIRKTWAIRAASLDQGNTGTCVGHAWRNFLRCAPIQTEKGGPSAFDVYRAAVLLDPWDDNDDETHLSDGDAGLDSGTSVRAGAKAVLATGRLKSYLWSFNLQPAVEWVLTEGPLVLGVNWYSSFMSPDKEGIIKITPNASAIGGHAILCRGVDNRRALATLENSWGEGWGKGGACFIPLADLERLIHEQGECCTAVEVKLAPKKVAGVEATK